jgi:phospholipase/carboxylesterase
MNHSLILQQPASDASQLFLLLHGVGGAPADLTALGSALADAYPKALIVSVAAASKSDISNRGYQWFSVRGVTENNRAERVRDAMPAFIATVEYWQRFAKVGADATAIIGFSQGAIMALEATQRDLPIAARVIAIAGRFATPPTIAPAVTTVHLFHGREDAVIAYQHSINAAERLLELGGDITAEILPNVGHEVSDGIVAAVLYKLSQYVPKRTWAAALSAAR